MKNLNKYIVVLALIMIAICLAGFIPITTQGEKIEGLYTMYVNGKETGTLKFAARGLAVYDKAVQELLNEYNNEVYIEGEVFFREKTDGYLEIDSDEKLMNMIRKAVDIKIDAYAIVINDRIACYVKTEEEAITTIDTIQKPFIEGIAGGNELANIALQENITFEIQSVFYAQLVDVERAVEIITVGEEGRRQYTVKSGDSLWSIARAFDIRIADIQAANPQLKGDNIHPGQELNIATVRSLVTVVTKEKHTFTEVITFTSRTQDDRNLFIGESKIIQNGKNGLKEIEEMITKENGVQINKEKIGERIITDPVPQITARGTKVRPAPVVSRAPSGNITRPTDTTPISRTGVELTPWTTANTIFTRGSIAKVTHLDTNLTFYVYRHGGSLHADVEPLSAIDTEIIRRIYGSFSWARESIMVEARGKKMAASMNFMPHGNYSINGNNFNGHFCIHFLNSRGHGSNRIDPDHQAALRRVVQ